MVEIIEAVSVAMARSTLPLRPAGGLTDAAACSGPSTAPCGRTIGRRGLSVAAAIRIDQRRTAWPASDAARAHSGTGRARREGGADYPERGVEGDVYGFNTRFGDGAGDESEELIAAAHALLPWRWPFKLQGAGLTPRASHRGALTMEQEGGGWTIKAIGWR
jgi:hypothetical protein